MDKWWRPDNIQYNKDAQLDLKKQQKFYIFCVIGYNFIQAMEYNTGNTNSKINAEIYINILSKLQKEILGKKLILWQDYDSVYLSKKVINQMDKHGIDYIKGPLTSPDLSIMETWVKLLR